MKVKQKLKNVQDFVTIRANILPKQTLCGFCTYTVRHKKTHQKIFYHNFYNT